MWFHALIFMHGASGNPLSVASMLEDSKLYEYNDEGILQFDQTEALHVSFGVFQTWYTTEVAKRFYFSAHLHRPAVLQREECPTSPSWDFLIIESDRDRSGLDKDGLSHTQLIRLKKNVLCQIAKLKHTCYTTSKSSQLKHSAEIESDDLQSLLQLFPDSLCRNHVNVHVQPQSFSCTCNVRESRGTWQFLLVPLLNDLNLNAPCFRLFTLDNFQTFRNNYWSCDAFEGQLPIATVKSCTQIRSADMLTVDRFRIPTPQVIADLSWSLRRSSFDRTSLRWHWLHFTHRVISHLNVSRLSRRASSVFLPFHAPIRSVPTALGRRRRGHRSN